MFYIESGRVQVVTRKVPERRRPSHGNGSEGESGEDDGGDGERSEEEFDASDDIMAAAMMNRANDEECIAQRERKVGFDVVEATGTSHSAANDEGGATGGMRTGAEAGASRKGAAAGKIGGGGVGAFLSCCFGVGGGDGDDDGADGVDAAFGVHRSGRGSLSLVQSRFV